MKVRYLVLFVVGSLALAGCYGNTMPDVQNAPLTCATAKVLFVGDSIMAEAVGPIIDYLHAHGYPIQTETMIYGGSNAAEFSWIDPAPWFWPTPKDELQWHLDNFHPDVVFSNWGMNKINSIWDTGLAFLGPWVIQNAMTDIIGRINASGARAYWTLNPPIGGSDENRDYFTKLNIFIGDINNVISGFGMTTADWNAALVDNQGGYGRWLKYPEDEEVHQVRSDDDVHLSADGILRVSKWTSANIGSGFCK